MKRNAKIIDTGEVVEVVSTNFGRGRVKFINRPKVEKRGAMVFDSSTLRMNQLEFI